MSRSRSPASGARCPTAWSANEELAQHVDTSDEWIVERTGIRERRMAAPEEALSDLALPAAREALEQAGVRGEDVDLVIVATVTPDMAFPSTAALIADQLGRQRSGRLRPLGRLHRLHVRDRPGLRDARRRAGEAGARRRRRHPLADARLGRPLDPRPLRRRRRGRRHGGGARAGLHRLRARRRRRRRLEPLAARQRLPPVHGARATSSR